MSHGLRVWNTNGFPVIDLNSRSFAVVAAGGGSVSVPGQGGNNSVTISVPNKANYLGRIFVGVSGNSGIHTQTSRVLEEFATGYRVRFYTYTTAPAVVVSYQYWVVVR